VSAAKRYYCDESYPRRKERRRKVAGAWSGGGEKMMGLGGAMMSSGRSRLIEANQARWRHEATHDALTGLPNRTFCQERLAATLPIQLSLPADLYERIQEAAARSDRPVESVLVESLGLLFGVPSADRDHLAAALEALSDAQLWALVYRRMAWIAGGRLRDLTARGKAVALSDEEQAELAALIDEADRMMLLRSQALLVLQQRGHNVQDQLRPGA